MARQNVSSCEAPGRASSNRERTKVSNVAQSALNVRWTPAWLNHRNDGLSERIN